MREILFRGKCAYDNSWIYGVPIQCYDGDWQICTDSARYTVKPRSIGEYTGLNDSNGAKIFEGDVVKWQTLYRTKYIGVVEYGMGCFAVRYGGNCPALDLVLNAAYDGIKVIGNIHDNPELLKGEEE